MTSQRADDEWLRAVRCLLEEGETVHPRPGTARATVELVGFQTCVDMGRPVVTNPARKLGYRFQAAEAAWILSGRSDVQTISRYSREISKFSDDGLTFFGAYGPKVVSQLDYVVSALTRDPMTRQAVVNIWRESPPETRDVPCTLSLQFLQRNSRLHCVASMRSSDIWLGWPYDVFNFSCVAAVVSMRLPRVLPLGDLTLTAGSQHMYSGNFEACVRLERETDMVRIPRSPWLDPRDYSDPGSFVESLWGAADGCGSLEMLKRVEASRASGA